MEGSGAVRIGELGAAGLEGSALSACREEESQPGEKRKARTRCSAQRRSGWRGPGHQTDSHPPSCAPCLEGSVLP